MTILIIVAQNKKYTINKTRSSMIEYDPEIMKERQLIGNCHTRRKWKKYIYIYNSENI